MTIKIQGGVVVDDSRNATFGGTLNVDGAVTLNGPVTLGNASTDDVVATARLVSDLVPSSTNSYDIGTTSLRSLDFFSDLCYATTFKTGNGSKAAPSFTFASNPDTGFYWDTDSDELRVSIDDSDVFVYSATKTSYAAAAETAITGTTGSYQTLTSTTFRAKSPRAVIVGSVTGSGVNTVSNDLYSYVLCNGVGSFINRTAVSASSSVGNYRTAASVFVVTGLTVGTVYTIDLKVAENVAARTLNGYGQISVFT